MTLSKKNKTYLIGGLSLVVFLLLLSYLGEIILPFVFALFIAYLLNPTILSIQKKVKSKSLAVTIFLVGITTLLAGGLVFFGNQIVNDSKRFVSAVEIFVDRNEDQINELKTNALGLVEDVYDSELVQNQIATTTSDSTKTEDVEKTLKSAFESVYSLISPSETKPTEPQKESWSWLYMLVYTIIYTVIILYTYDYFEEKYEKYFGNKKRVNDNLLDIWNDFKKVFLDYFRQRTKVVLLSTLIFILAFSLIDLPGAIIIGIISGILTYASQFHYFSLPLVGIGSWVLSVQNDTSFFIYFGILLAVYILVSILEETVFFTKIMKSVSGMNPAIVFLSFSLWVYVFGGFTGTIIALPLTQLIMIYADRLILYSQDKKKGK